MESFTSIDLVILGFILFLGLKGFFNGFIKEVFGIIGLVGGVFLGTRVGKDAGVYINDNWLHLNNESVLAITGFLATLIGFWLAMTIIGKIVSAIFDKAGLGTFDQLAGFVFASLKVAAILSIIFYTLLQFKVVKDNSTEYVENSKLIPELVEYGSYIVKADFTKVIQKTEEKTGLNIDETVEKMKEAMPSQEDFKNMTSEVLSK
jgi:membrane protein required for colicin V production